MPQGESERVASRRPLPSNRFSACLATPFSGQERRLLQKPSPSSPGGARLLPFGHPTAEPDTRPPLGLVEDDGGVSAERYRLDTPLSALHRPTKLCVVPRRTICTLDKVNYAASKTIMRLRSDTLLGLLLASNARFLPSRLAHLEQAVVRDLYPPPARRPNHRWPKLNGDGIPLFHCCGVLVRNADVGRKGANGRSILLRVARPGSDQVGKRLRHQRTIHNVSPAVNTLRIDELSIVGLCNQCTIDSRRFANSVVSKPRTLPPRDLDGRHPRTRTTRTGRDR